MSKSKEVTLHSTNDFIKLAKAGELAARILDFITPYVEPGVSTEKLDQLCHEEIIKNGAIPAPLGYNGYSKSICTSINHAVCHGIPSARKLEAGDILNIDVTVILDGWHGDTSRMYYVGGKVPIKASRLCKVTYDAMMKGIDAVKPGAKLSDIGKAIEEYVNTFSFSVVRDFCGHGIGKNFHDLPNILHYYNPNTKEIMQPGMVFTIEPMVNAGSHEVKVLQDGWTAVTKDRSLSAQFEHMVGVTEYGCEIFTISPKGWHSPPYK